MKMDNFIENLEETKQVKRVNSETAPPNKLFTMVLTSCFGLHRETEKLSSGYQGSFNQTEFFFFFFLVTLNIC